MKYYKENQCNNCDEYDSGKWCKWCVHAVNSKRVERVYGIGDVLREYSCKWPRIYTAIVLILTLAYFAFGMYVVVKMGAKHDIVLIIVWLMQAYSLYHLDKWLFSRKR